MNWFRRQLKSTFLSCISQFLLKFSRFMIRHDFYSPSIWSERWHWTKKLNERTFPALFVLCAVCWAEWKKVEYDSCIIFIYFYSFPFLLASSRFFRLLIHCSLTHWLTNCSNTNTWLDGLTALRQILLTFSFCDIIS
jgi:hypothetical protein